MLTIRINKDGQESETLSQDQLDIVTIVLNEKVSKKKFNQVVLDRLEKAGLPAIFPNIEQPLHGFNNVLETKKTKRKSIQ